MKNKIIVLLHGFKRNNEDDFGRVRGYLKKFEDEYEIHNVIWYDNYNKKTLNRRHLDNILNEVALKINEGNYEEIVIVGYSTGNVVAMYLLDKIYDRENVRYFGTVPPVEIEKFKWIERLKEMSLYKRKLRKQLGWRRYNRIQKKLKKEKKTEKYPLQIANYVYGKIIKPDGHRIGEVHHGKFLLALDDQVVNTKLAYRTLKKNPDNDITIQDFKHDQLFKLDQQVFIDWFDEKFKEH